MDERFELSLEILDAEFSAFSWLRGWRDPVTIAAITHGATEWHWHTRPWGVVLDVAFRDEAAAARWREHPSVIAALDAAPRVVVKRGWGGTSGNWEPRRPRPVAGAGAASVPIPRADELADAIAGSDPVPAGSGPRVAALR